MTEMTMQLEEIQIVLGDHEKWIRITRKLTDDHYPCCDEEYFYCMFNIMEFSYLLFISLHVNASYSLLFQNRTHFANQCSHQTGPLFSLLFRFEHRHCLTMVYRLH